MSSILPRFPPEVKGWKGGVMTSMSKEGRQYVRSLYVGGAAGNLPPPMREGVAAEVGITKKQLSVFLASERAQARRGTAIKTAIAESSGSVMGLPTMLVSGIGTTLRPLVPTVDPHINNLRRKEQLLFDDIPAETLVRLNRLYDIGGTRTEAEARTWGPSCAPALQISEEQSLRWFRWRSNVSSSESPAPQSPTSQRLPLFAPPAALRSIEDIKEEFYQDAPAQLIPVGFTRAPQDEDYDELMSDDSESQVKTDLETPTTAVHFGDQLPTPSATTSPEPPTWAAYPKQPLNQDTFLGNSSDLFHVPGARSASVSSVAVSDHTPAAPNLPTLFDAELMDYRNTTPAVTSFSEPQLDQVESSIKSKAEASSSHSRGSSLADTTWHVSQHPALNPAQMQTTMALNDPETASISTQFRTPASPQIVSTSLSLGSTATSLPLGPSKPNHREAIRAAIRRTFAQVNFDSELTPASLPEDTEVTKLFQQQNADFARLTKTLKELAPPKVSSFSQAS
ncbi:hypothetical protein FRB96_001164 [Tulasnella sp. 330]|nr:hypothetical protein FRB96_001164 [Tulasnella sp. 330]KAG8877180.1 hypothetical protein FRB97_003605 [Tulasnella sp. 331]